MLRPQLQWAGSNEKLERLLSKSKRSLTPWQGSREARCPSGHLVEVEATTAEAEVGAEVEEEDGEGEDLVETTLAVRLLLEPLASEQASSPMASSLVDTSSRRGNSSFCHSSN